MVNSEELPNWEALSSRFMQVMPRLYPMGIVAQTCNVSAELTPDELLKDIKK
jgi:hypothetical protein